MYANCVNSLEIATHAQLLLSAKLVELTSIYKKVLVFRLVQQGK